MAEPLLERMARSSAARARRARQREAEAVLRRRASSMAPPPSLRFHPAGFDLIAEVKRRAPSAGVLAAGMCSGERARLYADAGVAAVSVLTEPDEFGGSLGDLERAAWAVTVPAMRKDFLVDPYQVFEARAAGAGGVLLIARLAGDRRLAELLDAAAEAGVFALLEVFDAGDVRRARAALAARPPAAGDPPRLVGVNARDLRTLGLDVARFEQLAGDLPHGPVRVAESGLEQPADAARVARLGYGMALVGAALMRSGDPGGLVAAMLDAGRDAASAGHDAGDRAAGAVGDAAREGGS